MATNRWEAPQERVSGPEVAALEREMALVDRILALEAQLAEFSIEASLTPSDQLRAEQQIARMRRSTAWRVGYFLTTPTRVVRRRLTSVRGHD